MRGQRTATTTAAAAALLGFALTGVAMAADSGSMPRLTATGVEFSGGSYRFYYNECCRDFATTGNLIDTATDGNRVFVQARVAGYSYGGRTYTGSIEYKRVEPDDPAANFVSYADVQACQDRWTAFPDICTSTRLYR